MLHLIYSSEHPGLNWVAAQRLKRRRTHKVESIVGGDDADVVPPFLEVSHQMARLVRGDAAGYADNDS